jgi:hypothetical protein
VRHFVALAALVVAAAVAPVSASGALSALVDPYLRVQQALAADRTAGIRDEATAIASAAARLGRPAEGIVAAARKLQSAAGIAVARDAFFELTTAMFAYADATGASLGPDVRRAYCPMHKRTWAQKDGTISNPYDPSMPKCGRFTDGKK